MSITITVPNDDHVALRAMAKALEEIAVARGAATQGVTIKPFSERMKLLETALSKETPESLAAKFASYETELDTTSQQVESLGISDWKPFNPEEVKHDSLNLIGQIDEFVSPTDSTGTPWDERIHSASKALNGDGTWRLRRKPKDMDEAEWLALVESVKVELLHGDAIREAIDKAESGEAVYYTSEEAEQKMEEFKDSLRNPEPSVTPAGDDFHVDAGEVTEQEVADIPAPPLPPVPSVDIGIYQGAANSIGANPTAITFPQVMQFLTERHGRITSAQVDDIIADMGLNSIMDLNTQPEHTGPFIARVKALLGE